MDLSTMQDYIVYLIAFIIVLGGLYFMYMVFTNAKRVSVKSYEDVKGTVRLERESSSEGITVVVGKMKDKDKLSVALIKDKSGTPCKTVTDAKGNYFFKDVPEGVFWVVATKSGFKTTMKMIKVTKGALVRVPEILMK